MTYNERLIEKYKDFDKVIKTYYQAKDHNGKLVNIDGVVNPLKLDFRQQCSVADDQGSTSECAAYSICNWIEALIWKRTGKLINLNPDQVYAGAKQIDGMKNQDGTMLECAIKSAFKLGGFENVDNLKIGFLYNDGTTRTIEQIKFLIHKYEFLHIGFNVYQGWFNCNENDPYVKHQGQCAGGHAVLACGYDNEGLYIQNSWGKSWGAKSFGIVKWDVFLQDFIYSCFVENVFKF